MSEAPLSISTPKEISETISIEQNNTKYALHVSSIGETLTFLITISEELKNKIFMRKLALKEIKDAESHPVFIPYSCKEFIEHLKTLSEMKKISLTIKQNIVFINLTVEFISKKHLIEIELFPEDKNFDSIGKELYRELSLENLELKNRMNELEKQVKELQKLIEPNININKLKLSNKSVIMKENEFEMINLAIKSRINKEIKELKKLYQATIDGDGTINFHSRCDNIPNTLVLIKSAGNRRF